MCADQTAGDATPDPMVGRTFGGEFRLVRLLGAGGMGSVYLAEQVSLRRTVAVKLLPAAATASETSVARFQREAVAAARLQHPNIVQVHFFGQQDGQYFIAMEYVEGTSLHARLQRLGKLPVAEAVRVSREVARALAAAQPTDVAAAAARARISQAKRDREAASQRGATFKGFLDAASIARVTANAGDAPESWAKVIDAASQAEGLAQTDEEKKQVASLLAEAKRFLAVAEGQVRLADALARARQAVDSRTWDAAAKALEVAFSIDPANADAKALEARAREGLYATFMERGKSLAGERKWAEAKAAFGKAAELKAGDAFAKRAITDVEELREEDPLCFEQAHRLEGHEKWVMGVGFDREGTVLASAGGDNTVRLWERATGKPLAVLKGHEDLVHSVAFSPAGGLLVSASKDHTVRIWNPVTHAEVRKYAKHAHPVFGAVFTPNGRCVASVDESGELRMWNVKSGEDVWTTHASRDRTQSLAISPDGKTLATGSDDTTISLWNAANGKPLGSLHGHEHSVIDLEFSPDGRVLASAGYDDKTVRLWDWAAGKAIAVLTGHQSDVCSLAFSPRLPVLVSGDRAGVLIFWDLATQKSAHTLQQARGKVPDLAFTPDGKLLASASDDCTVDLWCAPK